MKESLSGKEPACNAGDTGSILGSGRSPGEGNGYPLQYSSLKNSMDKESLADYSAWGWRSQTLSHFHYEGISMGNLKEAFKVAF